MTRIKAIKEYIEAKKEKAAAFASRDTGRVYRANKNYWKALAAYKAS